ncbi:Ger(x)C family spore germination protein [Salipaludibacillus agaradhaerens]|uniref:Ger(x)C family spore germination protein n=1 Tax=Salipaludibacillus agaradhaerens TaxID=76935 RepID=UPI002150EDBD|nr:Ger(x)C family spore germination protein [Salipaludibacillus agaradhaerens]MCR6106068.1 Ger(x)C family spore germination protein [Salipaludibacillus agaradhaerens]MCR6118101.1 Ger(x)C family spore germination protein [Salipaludibacillus agaradhaerens]
MIKYSVTLILIIFSLVCLTSCWDNVEIDELALVMGSGFDITDEGNLFITIQIATPTEHKGGRSSIEDDAHDSVLHLTAEGEDGTEVLNRMQQQLSRQIFLGHRAILVFGDHFATNGLDQVIDLFSRSPDSRFAGNVLTAYKTDAKSILNTEYPLEDIPSIALRRMQSEGNSFSITLDEFLSSLARKDKATITGAVSVIDGISGQFYFINHAAVYRDNRLAGYLDEEQMKIVLWRRGEIEGTYMTLDVMEKTDEFKGTVGVRFTGGKSVVEVEKKAGKPHIIVNYSGKGLVIENDTPLDLNEETTVNMVEKGFEKYAKELFEETLSYAQEDLQVDIFNFAEEVHIQEPRYWQEVEDEWGDIFSELKVTFNCDFHIISSGRTDQPSHMEE